ncbi:gluconate permease [Sphingomonas oleivorans]|uniref:Gluconate permease n=1 Tax=Sphingomonas oleivorans TaxID=1735121 RepID=A0A2T5FVD5_9SPHN|nr:gluconate:H+ symporter [Sphingomonas oleivorans]PTQ09413.1 gluconate permease [Sphingomonas oleivorans]
MSDLLLIGSAFLCVAIAVLLIVRFRIHPFIGLLCAAFLLAIMRGLGVEGAVGSVEKGFGNILGGAGLVVALGLTLGAMMQVSGAASVIATATVGAVRERYRPWSCLGAAMLLGLPLFFETGVVLLLPIIAAVAAQSSQGAHDARQSHLPLMLPALSGLSVLHALLPPHPGPMIAVDQLQANVGMTMLYGLLVGIPTAIVAGPLFSRYAERWVRSDPIFEDGAPPAHRVPLGISLLIVLLPVILIAAKAFNTLFVLPAGPAATIDFLGTPVVALLVANLLALLLFFAPPARRTDAQALWSAAMVPAGSILLSIGAGGALKQVLVDAGLAETLSRIARDGGISPIIMGWTIAVLIRLATGSATVATITASGVMSTVALQGGVAVEWVVLAIGAGSVFFSHVNDPGFWLVKGYLRTSTLDTFKSWSVLETLISVVGFVLILVASRII